MAAVAGCAHSQRVTALRHGVQAGHLIGVPPQRRDGSGRAHRYRHDHPAGASGPGHHASRTGRHPGRDRVIDDERGTARQRHQWPATAQPSQQVIQPDPFPRLYAGDLLPGQAGLAAHMVVDDPRAALADGPKPHPGRNGTPSLRTTITSRGARSSRATSDATGTPPRGNASTTTSVPRSCDSDRASRGRRPAVHGTSGTRRMTKDPGRLRRAGAAWRV
jgi:hypothetical protein